MTATRKTSTLAPPSSRLWFRVAKKLSTPATAISPINSARTRSALILAASMEAAAVQRWIDAWAEGWAAHDVERIRELYTDGARHRSEPFREVGDPGDYAAWAFSNEERAEIWFARPRVTGEETAACEWWAISTASDGRTVTLAGVSLLHFAPDGRVGDQRDYWSELDGSREPPEDWGPVAAHCHGGAQVVPDG
jgi:hypothetical protein